MLDEAGVAVTVAARKGRYRLQRAIGALTILVAGAQPLAADDASGASDVIRRLNSSFESVLKEAEKLGYEGRAERLAPVIDATFDLDFMARTAVGRHWSELSADDQRRWIETFRRMTIANYAGRLDHYSGQSFEFLNEESSANDTVVVNTRVVDPGKETVDINYRLRKTDTGWRAIDIYLKGTVSELALRRSEYTTLLKREGFPALLASIDQKITDLKSGAAAGAGVTAN